LALAERLVQFTTPTPVLDHGHVQLIDVMGDDLAVVEAARVSFAATASKHSDNQNRSLLRYLMKHEHMSPFEMCEIKLRIRVPMDTWRHWIRHRTASVNEVSTRYTEALDLTTVASEWRLQSTDNKQGSQGLVTEWPEGVREQHPFHSTPGEYLSHRETELHRLSREIYAEKLTFGVAKEQARKDLPLGTYTEAYWKVDLRNLLHFLRLRLDPLAQTEIRAYANAIARIVEEWVPWTWEAFQDYQLQSIVLSREEASAVQTLLHRLVKDGYREDALIRGALSESPLKGRERSELETKLRRLFHNRETTVSRPRTR
jgi:thymidylate synthase (FAD)